MIFGRCPRVDSFLVRSVNVNIYRHIGYHRVLFQFTASIFTFLGCNSHGGGNIYNAAFDTGSQICTSFNVKIQGHSITFSNRQLVDGELWALSQGSCTDTGEAVSVFWRIAAVFSSEMTGG